MLAGRLRLLLPRVACVQALKSATGDWRDALKQEWTVEEWQEVRGGIPYPMQQAAQGGCIQSATLPRPILRPAINMRHQCSDQRGEHASRPEAVIAGMIAWRQPT